MHIFNLYQHLHLTRKTFACINLKKKKLDIVQTESEYITNYIKSVYIEVEELKMVCSNTTFL